MSNQPETMSSAFYTDKKLTEAMVELQKTMGSRTDFINRGDLSTKTMTAYTLYMYSYSNSVNVLYQSNCLTAIHSLARDMLEIYAKLKQLFNTRKTGGDVNDVLCKFILDDMEQDRKILNDFMNDPTSDQPLRDAAKKNYLARLDSFLQKYFSSEYHLVDQTDIDNSVPKQVKSIYETYKKKYPQHSDKSGYIEKALLDNYAYQVEMKRTFVDAKPMYRLLCSYTHANFGAVDELTSRDGMFTLQPVTKNIEMLMSTMFWCLKDIAYEWVHIS